MGNDNKIFSAVITYVKDQVRGGNLQPGGKLPTEREMAESLQMSRNSVREALRTLDNMGILECKQGSGNYLHGTLGRGFSDALSMHILMDTVQQDEVLQMKCSLEASAFVGVVTHGMEHCDLEEMARLLERMENAPATAAEADEQFHRNLIRWDGNAMFACLEEAISDALGDTMYCRVQGEKRKQLNVCHREILLALQNRDIQLGMKAIGAHYQLIEDALCKGRELRYAENIS